MTRKNEASKERSLNLEFKEGVKFIGSGVYDVKRTSGDEVDYIKLGVFSEEDIKKSTELAKNDPRLKGIKGIYFPEL